jgi:hypothetical protein
MNLTLLKDPQFMVVADQNIQHLENALLPMVKGEWYPMGNPQKKGADWVQVLVREKPKE